MQEKRLLEICPKQYNLLLTPDLTNFTFAGEETVEFTLHKETQEITLHAYTLEVREATLEESGKKLSGVITYNTQAKTVIIAFPQEIKPGEKKLHLVFTGIIGEQLKGWYKSAYEVNGQEHFLVTSHFEEIGARQVFPCIDDPAAKAVFNISLVIPKNLTAIANTDPKHITEKGDKKIVEFLPTPKMSTYIVAMIVGEFESLEDKTETGITVRVSVTPGKKHLAKFAVKTAARMLSFYEKYFDIAYPLPKLDLIAIPDFDAGAMENWGAVTAREAALLIDEERSAAMNKQWVATVIAHEITHMWFGNLVTLEWWTYLWLNEGFASFMEYLALDEFFPEWHVWEQFAVLDHNRALGLDGLAHTHPVEVEVTDLEKLIENFDEISYSKGASVIYMLASFLGKEDFRKGIQEYLKTHAYETATTEDLWIALEKTSKKPVKKIMHEFVTKAGHPMIQVIENENDFGLTQERFYKSSLSKKANIDKTLWNIPFAVSSSTNAFDSEYLMEEKTTTLPTFPDVSWIKINKDETSFMRCIYNKNLYNKLEKPIKEKILSTIDRMGVLRDAFDGAEAGYVTTDFALQLVRNYANETEYIVLAALSGKLAKVANLVSNTRILKQFNVFAQSLFLTMGKQVGWGKKPTDTHKDILLRSVILYALGTYGHVQTIATAQGLFKEYIEKKKPIDNDIRGLVYRIVGENGGKREFELLKELYINESLHEERNRIGSALVSFKDPVLVQEGLDFSLSKYVRLQDIGRFIMLGFDNTYGREITWEFVKKHWEYLAKKHEGLNGMGWLIEGAASFTDKLIKEDIEAFFTNHPTPQLTRTIQQVVEQIAANIAWLERDEKAIAEFLHQ